METPKISLIWKGAKGIPIKQRAQGKSTESHELQSVFRVFQGVSGYFQGIFRVFSGCFQGAFRVLSGCFQGVFPYALSGMRFAPFQLLANRLDLECAKIAQFSVIAAAALTTPHKTRDLLRPQHSRSPCDQNSLVASNFLCDENGFSSKVTDSHCGNSLRFPSLQ